MSQEVKPIIKKIEWGDDHVEEIRIPDLRHIPGDSVVCPTPCYPHGDDPKEWVDKSKVKYRPMRAQ